MQKTPSVLSRVVIFCNLVSLFQTVDHWLHSPQTSHLPHIPIPPPHTCPSPSYLIPPSLTPPTLYISHHLQTSHLPHIPIPPHIPVPPPHTSFLPHLLPYLIYLPPPSNFPPPSHTYPSPPHTSSPPPDILFIVEPELWGKEAGYHLHVPTADLKCGWEV